MSELTVVPQTTQEDKVTVVTINTNNDDDNNVVTESSSTTEKTEPTTENSAKKSEPDFNKTFDDFISFCFEILKYRMSNNLELQSVGSSSIIRTYLDNYNTIYKKSRKSHKHVVQIQEIWEKCKEFLTYDKDLPDDVDIESFALWLEKNSLVIAPPTDNPKAKIMVSTIFDNALKISRSLMQKADGLEKLNKKDEANKIYESTAINYSNTFLLLLFRLFQFSTRKITTENGETKPQIYFNPSKIITQSIQKLESSLGIEENETFRVDGGLEDLLGGAGEIMSSLGIQLPEEMDINKTLKGQSRTQTRGQMKQALQEIQSRPELKGMMQGLFSGLNPKDPASISIVLNNLMSKMQQGMPMPEPLQRATQATSDNTPAPTLALPPPSSNSSTNSETK